ncbi:GreA/GreB family elongation factor [Desulfuromonas sp. KJ2020]|uniref:GreA/GreB family elongation factor n=1 Tax=Desulfuromonas sp. KJ2020 TaxID=2919173 RepID=UPI0020A80AFB|nr:GreA/GreB family elongation factor [Desulfuromonas sp. KJ2020]MCP3176709.1 GreA/GreB family elongation factor [Desulfuromonas sp. KJ2020]
MNQQTLTFTDYDVERLEIILEGAQRSASLQKSHLEALAEELEKGDIVSSREIGADVVTLNSRVRLRDMASDKEMEVTLVLPMGANFSEGRLSVTSPLGIALLGYTTGSVIEWPGQAGRRKARIEAVLYQPEAAGHYHL